MCEKCNNRKKEIDSTYYEMTRSFFLFATICVIVPIVLVFIDVQMVYPLGPILFILTFVFGLFWFFIRQKRQELLLLNEQIYIQEEMAAKITSELQEIAAQLKANR